jgi:hypothetical protein
MSSTSELTRTQILDLVKECDTAAQRQKFQRAFAQEFLCPFLERACL